MVEFVEDRDTIRQQVVQILTATLKEEVESRTPKVRKRITSQKKKSLRAARSGMFLYRKYYAQRTPPHGHSRSPVIA